VVRWLRRLWARLRGLADPFELSETVQAPVSPIEMRIYRFDADRNGLSMNEWIRTTLNAGVSAHTMKHLAKGNGSRKTVMDMAFDMLDEDEIFGGPVLPLPPERKYMDRISGHPCRHLNPTIPANFTANECQGVCKSTKVGFNGRPCFWAPLAAKNCDGFEPKRVLPLANKARSR
jgi:hypothetical protein